MKYAHEIAKEAVESLTVDSSNSDIAEALTTYLLCGKTMPVILCLNHNAKVSPCPLPIDSPGIKRCMITMHVTTAAEAWVREALLRGYEVSVGKSVQAETRSIAAERRHAEYRSSMAAWRANHKVGEDDIPF